MKQINFKNIFKIYKGTLREYTEELWINKRGDGSVVNLGEMHPAVVSELAEKNIYLEDTRILVDQRSATKYFAHPKSKKERYCPLISMIFWKKAVKQPLKIFEDATQGDLVYIYSYPYEQGKIVKLVVQPNYRKNGRIYNNAKSWGIIQEGNLNNPKQYRLVWKSKRNGA